MAYEGVALGSTLAELVAMAAARGWKQNAQDAPDADQTVTVFPAPGHPVRRYKLGYERGVLINIQIEYRVADAGRLALRDDFAISRLVKDTWYMADGDRQVLAAMDARGETVRALHVGRLRDRAEAKALLRFGLGD